MLKDYQILCHKYRYASTTLTEDINYFSTATKTLEQTIDLTAYHVDTDSFKIESNYVKVQDKAGLRTQRRFSSAVDLKLDDSDSVLRTFFELYSDTKFLKYFVEIKDAFGIVIWTGIIPQESISALMEDIEAFEETEIIDLTATEFDSEFKEYFSSKELPLSTTLLMWMNADYNVTWFVNNAPPVVEPVKYAYFHDILSSLFYPFTAIQADVNIGTYRVFKDAFITGRSGQLGNYVQSKTGYENLYRLKESKWGFLEKICNAMGWDFYFKNGVLKIENRSQVELTTEEISTELFLRYSISKDKAEDTFKHIAIDGGTEWFDAAGFKYETADMNTVEGVKRYLITDAEHSDKMTYFNWMQAGKLKHSAGHKFMSVQSEDDNELRVKLCEWTQSGGNWGLNYTYITIDKRDILYINAGNTGVHYAVYNQDQYYNFSWADGVSVAINNQEFRFSGNYGDVLFSLNSNNEVITYDRYFPTSQCQANFKPFLQNKQSTLRITAVIDEIRTTFANRIELTGNTDLAGVYMIDKFKADLEKEQTEIELIKIAA